MGKRTVVIIRGALQGWLEKKEINFFKVRITILLHSVQNMVSILFIQNMSLKIEKHKVS